MKSCAKIYSELIGCEEKALALVLVLTMIMMVTSTVFAADATTATETWQVAVGKETAASSLDSDVGSFMYYCSTHPTMVGAIIVAE